MKQRQYNLDKTAYDLEKENKRFIWKFFTYLYFLLFSLRNFRRFILCVELLDLLETYRHLEF